MAVTTTVIQSPDGHYATVDDLDAWLGEANVSIYSNPLGQQARSDTRIEEALTYADAAINQVLRQNGFTAPLSSSHAAYDGLKDVAMNLALWRLLRPSRQNRDEGESAGADAYLGNSAKKYAANRLATIVRFDLAGAERFTDAATWPVAVE